MFIEFDCSIVLGVDDEGEDGWGAARGPRDSVHNKGALRAYFTAAQNRWMRLQASSNWALEVA